VKMLLSMPRSQTPRDGAEQTQRHDEDDGQRQAPTLVLRRQREEDEQHAERENEDDGVCRPGFPGRWRSVHS